MATTMPNPAEQAPAAPQEPQQQAPPVQAPPVEAPPQLFERTALEDGTIQVKLNTGEIFTGTPDELVEKLAGSAAHTHVYGKRLKTQLDQFQQQQQPQAPIQQPNQVPVDPAEQMIADIAARSMGFQNAAEQRQAYERLNASQMEIQGRMVANQFMSENPDFAPSDHNSRILTETLAQNGMPETPPDAGHGAPVAQDAERLRASRHAAARTSVSACPGTAGNAERQQSADGAADDRSRFVEDEAGRYCRFNAEIAFCY